MRVPIWLVVLTGLVMLGLLATIMFLIGRNDGADMAAAQSANVIDPAVNVAIPLPENAIENAPENATATAPKGVYNPQDIVGLWGPVEENCGGAMVEVYTAKGRYGESADGTGSEGRWTIGEGTLERRIDYDVTRGEEADDNGDTSSTPRHETQRFSILQLSGDRLTIADSRGTYKYLKCPQGHFTFADGAEVGG